MAVLSFPVSLSLVIPCYNEAARIGLLYAGIEQFLNKNNSATEVIIVNDGSRDDTAALLESHPVFARFAQQIRIITQQNTGKGGALQNGTAQASGQYILTLDADMATAPSELFRWLDIWAGSIPANTIFIGSREHPESNIQKQGDRKVAGNIFNKIIRLLTPLRQKDTQCGFKLYPAAAAKKYFGSLFTPGWAHDVEILYKACLDGMGIVEMPITWRAVEGSKINLLRDGYLMFTEVWKISRKLRKSRSARHTIQV